MTEAKTPLEAIAETAYDAIIPTGWTVFEMRS
jgi:hypothetical protein